MNLKLSGHLCQHPHLHCPSTRNIADNPILSKWEVWEIGCQEREKQGLAFTLMCPEMRVYLWVATIQQLTHTNMITSYLW